MNNFNLHTPTRILFGKGAIAGLREQIPHDARVLITYGGGSVKKTGVLDQVLDALKGMDVLEFGGIEPTESDFPAGGWRRFCTGRHQIYRRSG